MAREFVVRSATDLGRAVREARLSAGLTQESLAIAVGIDRSYLARLETGLSVVLLERVMRLLRQLGAEVRVIIPQDSDGS